MSDGVARKWNYNCDQIRFQVTPHDDAPNHYDLCSLISYSGMDLN